MSAFRTGDPSGVVAGFADATGQFLPLACTLNCTLAIDRVASWLRLDREDVEPSGDVVVLPYLDGERTPDLPGARATLTGLRHATHPGQILMAAYEGATASLIEALEAIAVQAGGGDPAAPIVLVGGGALATASAASGPQVNGHATGPQANGHAMRRGLLTPVSRRALARFEGMTIVAPMPAPITARPPLAVLGEPVEGSSLDGRP